MRAGLIVGVLVLGVAAPAHAVVSTRSVPSAMSGNGHNVAFDGRLYVTRTSVGWEARLLRPEAVTYGSDGLPDAMGPMWSPSVVVLTGADPSTVPENALALCEPDASRAPFSCDESGAAASGPYDCYDVQVFDSDASRSEASGGQRFRRRELTVWVANPKTATATIHKYTWGAITQVSTLGGGELHGIEPTFTSDGKLLVWNGSLDNTEQNGEMMYALAPTACALTGWSAPQSLSHMVHDPAVAGYRLAERTLRAADGTPYPDGAPVYGAYPWLLPSGDGVMFSAAPMPCRATDDPPGCGPRRNATSFLGYPTNWGLAVIDGGVNPSTTDTVRLFFSSPGPTTFSQLPVTPGQDVWPFFGSNTSNYVEVSFDDGLDGNYAGYWHMNEVVGIDGELDRTRSGDVSGYFNTAVIPPAPVARDLLGTQSFGGSGTGASITDDGSLDPTSLFTLQLAVRPSADPDCDANNNWRVLALKGDWANQAYSLLFEEGRQVHARVYTAAGAEYELWSNRVLPLDAWSTIGVTYDASTGLFVMYVNGSEVNRASYPPAALRTASGALQIAGPSTAAAACPDGLGTFAGDVQAVNVSSDDLAPGATFPAANNGWLGKAVELDGMKGYLEVPHATSLEPVNAITMDLRVKLADDPDCDANNNYRTLLDKGQSYGLTLEETRGVRARVRVAGGAIRELYSGAVIPIGQWTRVSAEYLASTGEMQISFDGVVVASQTFAPALLEGDGAPLDIGGRGVRAACPDGDGDIHGTIDEVSISRVARTLGAPPAPDAGVPDASAGSPDGGNPAQGGGGGCCDQGGGTSGSLLLALFTVVAVRTAGRRARPRCS